MTQTPNPPAGWYPQGGQERWWDGNAWSDNFRPLGSEATQPMFQAAAQPGYRGVDSARGADGIGITVSYWADEDAAIAWRRNARHGEIREAGRGRWYRWYSLHVAEIGRSYDWEKE